MNNRTAKVERPTNETDIIVKLNIDGKGIYSINTPVPFINHMLELFSKHGLFDIEILAKGDVEIDYHHTVEDIGICLGECFKKAVGDKKGIKRYGFFILPMDESLCTTSVDISNRPYLRYDVNFPDNRTGDFDVELVQEFFSKFVSSFGINLHIKLENSKNVHHGIESIFKSVAKSLDIATFLDDRIDGIMSTKGSL